MGAKLNPQDDHVRNLGRAPKYPIGNMNFGSEAEILAVEVLTFPSNAPKLGPQESKFIMLIRASGGANIPAMRRRNAGKVISRAH